MTTPRLYPYVSVEVDLPPEQAEPAFDFACGRLVPGGPPRLIEVASGLLILASDPTPGLGSRYQPLRTVRATLRPRARASLPVRVELELFPWSRDRAELGLIHAGRTGARPGERAVRHYVRVADDVLDILRATLEWTQPALLARLDIPASGPGAPPPRSGGPADPSPATRRTGGWRS